jgi:hypothetical protein
VATLTSTQQVPDAHDAGAAAACTAVARAVGGAVAAGRVVAAAAVLVGAAVAVGVPPVVAVAALLVVVAGADPQAVSTPNTPAVAATADRKLSRLRCRL